MKSPVFKVGDAYAVNANSYAEPVKWFRTREDAERWAMNNPDAVASTDEANEIAIVNMVENGLAE